MNPGTQLKTANGFTLIEFLIVVALVGFLLTIALPSYQDYVRRGKIGEATSELAAFRARQEQYFQDNRTYVSGGNLWCSLADRDQIFYLHVPCDHGLCGCGHGHNLHRRRDRHSRARHERLHLYDRSRQQQANHCLPWGISGQR